MYEEYRCQQDKPVQSINLNRDISVARTARSTHSHIRTVIHSFSSLFKDNHFVDDYARFSTLDTQKKSTAVANSMNYMTKKGKRVSYDTWSQKNLWSLFLDNLVTLNPKQALHVFSFCPPPFIRVIIKSFPASGMTTTNRHGNHPFSPHCSLSSSFLFL